MLLGDCTYVRLLESWSSAPSGVCNRKARYLLPVPMHRLWVSNTEVSSELAIHRKYRRVQVTSHFSKCVHSLTSTAKKVKDNQSAQSVKSSLLEVERGKPLQSSVRSMSSTAESFECRCRLHRGWRTSIETAPSPSSPSSSFPPSSSASPSSSSLISSSLIAVGSRSCSSRLTSCLIWTSRARMRRTSSRASSSARSSGSRSSSGNGDGLRGRMPSICRSPNQSQRDVDCAIVEYAHGESGI